MHSQQRHWHKSWVFLRVDNLLFSRISNLKFCSSFKPWVCSWRSTKGRDRRCVCAQTTSPSDFYNLHAAKIWPFLLSWQVCAALGNNCVEMSLVFLLLSILIKAPTLQRALSQEALPGLGIYFDHSIEKEMLGPVKHCISNGYLASFVLIPAHWKVHQSHRVPLIRLEQSPSLSNWQLFWYKSSFGDVLGWGCGFFPHDVIWTLLEHNGGCCSV